jgi:hypothetical protein
MVFPKGSAVCIPGAKVEVVAGQAIGRSDTQGECSWWGYGDDEIEFRDLTLGVEMTLRASASGYIAQEKVVVPLSKSEPQTPLIFELSKSPHAAPEPAPPEPAPPEPAPPEPAPPPESSKPGIVWAMVVEDSGVCIPDATVQVVAGPGRGQGGKQETPCDAWGYGGGITFEGLTAGAKTTLRASAPGYTARERVVIPKSGSYSAEIFELSRTR